mmetsp:Transcript_33751/g.52554  ORF Transcript_33751/g.52554 Transcript_33751/m.52554 type:complete len:240 (+) Transcript_33751:2-721(+)
MRGMYMLGHMCPKSTFRTIGARGHMVTMLAMSTLRCIAPILIGPIIGAPGDTETLSMMCTELLTNRTRYGRTIGELESMRIMSGMSGTDRLSPGIAHMGFGPLRLESLPSIPSIRPSTASVMLSPGISTWPTMASRLTTTRSKCTRWRLTSSTKPEKLWKGIGSSRSSQVIGLSSGHLLRLLQRLMLPLFPVATGSGSKTVLWNHLRPLITTTMPTPYTATPPMLARAGCLHIPPKCTT